MYARVARWESASPESIRESAEAVSSSDGPPDGVPAKRLLMLADENSGNVMMIPLFESEEDMKTAHETLSNMSPPADMGELKSVEMYEVKLDLQAPE